MYYTNNIPYYRDNMYPKRSYTNNYSSYQSQDRLIGGGFAFPFALGFLSAPLLLGPNINPRPYPPRPYPPRPYPPRPYPYY